MTRRFILVLMASVLATAAGLSAQPAASTSAPATASAPAAASRPAVCRAIVLGSLTEEPTGPYARNMQDWIKRFVKILTDQKVPAGNIAVLAEQADAKANPPSAECTLENVRKAFAAATRELGPDDQFVLFMVGHGTVTEPAGKFCLPGADLTNVELARLLDELPTRNVVVINCASGGAEFLAKYAHPGRVCVSATGMLGEGVQTYLAEFFLLGIETGKADRDGDGRVTVLEAFNWSAGECINWYHRQKKTKTGAPAPGGKVAPIMVEVRGRETCRLFKKFYDGSNIQMSRQGSNPNEDDAEPDFGKIEGGYGSVWNFRRETTELASLEDRGEPAEAALHWVANKHVILEGKPGEQGQTAARVVLGQPALLPASK